MRKKLTKEDWAKAFTARCQSSVQAGAANFRGRTRSLQRRFQERQGTIRRDGAGRVQRYRAVRINGEAEMMDDNILTAEQLAKIEARAAKRRKIEAGEYAGPTVIVPTPDDDIADLVATVRRLSATCAAYRDQLQSWVDGATESQKVMSDSIDALNQAYAAAFKERDEARTDRERLRGLLRESKRKHASKACCPETKIGACDPAVCVGCVCGAAEYNAKIDAELEPLSAQRGERP